MALVARSRRYGVVARATKIRGDERNFDFSDQQIPGNGLMINQT
jgi:hypothetical protein